MPEDWRTWLVVGAIALLLIGNLVALSRIGELRDQVNNLQLMRGDVIGLRNDLERTETRLEEIRQEQQWITAQDWTIASNEDSVDCKGEVPIQVSWSFREFSGDPTVYFEYRARGAADWQRVEAEPADTVDYRATVDLAIDSLWEHRVVAVSEEQTRTSDPESLEDLASLTDRTVMFEHGESLDQDSTRWVRFVIGNLSPRLSPCNEIASAEIDVYDGDELIDSFSLEPGYPGDHQPEGYEAPADSEAAEAPDRGRVSSVHEGADDREDWWTDWVEWTGQYELVATVAFRDGTERTIDRMGAN